MIDVALTALPAGPEVTGTSNFAKRARKNLLECGPANAPRAKAILIALERSLASPLSLRVAQRRGNPRPVLRAQT